MPPIRLQPNPTDYAVEDDDSVHLDVIVGHQQLGTPTVQFQDESTPLSDGVDVTDLPVGEGSEITGRILRVTTTVTITNPNSTQASVTYKLRGGVEDEEYSHSSPSQSGGSVIFDAKFRFVS